MKKATSSPVPDAGGDPGLTDRILARLDALCPEGALGVAVSGGGDSMALLAIAARWGAVRSRAVHAVTVDHGLRAEAAEEADLVVRTCKVLDIPHTLLTVDRLPEGGNLMAAARDARYRLIARWAVGQVAAVALAHTRDDQAETVLMRLARGSGVYGLSAMAPRRQRLGTIWLRPLLDTPRGALREWLRAEGHDWAEDPTNEDDRFDRVQIRRALDVLEPLGITRAGLAETAMRLQDQRAALEAAVTGLEHACLTHGALGEMRLALPLLRAAPHETALRLLRRVLVGLTGAPYPPRHAALERLWSVIRAPDFRGATLAGTVVERAGDDIVLCREPAGTSAAQITASPFQWDGRWRITVPGKAPPLWAAVLGDAGTAEVQRRLNALGRTPPQRWTDAPPAVRAATPGIFAGAEAGPRQLLAAPLAGLQPPVQIGTIRVDPPHRARHRTPGDGTEIT